VFVVAELFVAELDLLVEVLLDFTELVELEEVAIIDEELLINKVELEDELVLKEVKLEDELILDEDEPEDELVLEEVELEDKMLLDEVELKDGLQPAPKELKLAQVFDRSAVLLNTSTMLLEFVPPRSHCLTPRNGIADVEVREELGFHVYLKLSIYASEVASAKHANR
jgi:hypothetical protein